MVVCVKAIMLLYGIRQARVPTKAQEKKTDLSGGLSRFFWVFEHYFDA